MSSDNTLLILGAGEDQAPAYIEARKMGYKTIGIDQKKDAPGTSLADTYLCISTRDTQNIIRALGSTSLKGILSPASDASQKTLYELTRYYQTAYQPSLASTMASTEKGYFLRIVRELSFPHYQFVQNQDAAALLAGVASFHFPVIVKPSDSSGSKGISIVNARDRLKVAIEHARKYSFCGDIIVEEFIAGKHCSVEIFLRDGRLHFMAISEKSLTELPSLVTQAHLVPARVATALSQQLELMMLTICKKLHIVNGPVNFDFIISPSDQIYFIEMGARLGGNGLPQLIENAFGVNTVRAAIQAALGEPFDLTPTLDQKAVLYILHSPRAQEGRLRRIVGLEALVENKSIKLLEIFARPGEWVKPFTQSAHKLGYLLIRGDSYLEIERTLALSLEALKFEFEPNSTREEVYASYMVSAEKKRCDVSSAWED